VIEILHDLGSVWIYEYRLVNVTRNYIVNFCDYTEPQHIILPLLDNIGAQKVCESAMFLEMGVAGIMKLCLFK
jgi:hypothetical protein